MYGCTAGTCMRMIEYVYTFLQIGPTRSVDQPLHSRDGRDNRPMSHVPQYPTPDSTEWSDRAGRGARRGHPPPKPPPYIPQVGERNHRVPSGTLNHASYMCTCPCMHMYMYINQYVCGSHNFTCTCIMHVHAGVISIQVC